MLSRLDDELRDGLQHGLVVIYRDSNISGVNMIDFKWAGSLDAKTAKALYYEFKPDRLCRGNCLHSLIDVDFEKLTSFQIKKTFRRLFLLKKIDPRRMKNFGPKKHKSFLKWVDVDEKDQRARSDILRLRAKSKKLRAECERIEKRISLLTSSINRVNKDDVFDL